MSCAETPRPARTHYRAIILSPHLDDAVFSCGGAIARLVTEGPVLVLNLFTGYGAGVKSHGVVLTDARYQEEAEAAALLGYEALDLGELDAAVRRPAYRSLGNIFRPPVADDIAWLPALRQRLLAVLEGVRCQQLLVPLGIGWHVDHVLTHTLLDGWAGAEDRCCYEDLPYGLLPHATRLRLAETGQLPPGAGDASLRAPPLWTAWREMMAEYLATAMMKNLRPWPLRMAAAPVVGTYLYRLMARHARAPAALDAGRWQPEVERIDERFERKLDAMMLYRSQFREFFLDRADCAAMLRRYGARLAGQGIVAERRWRRAGSN